MEGKVVLASSGGSSRGGHGLHSRTNGVEAGRVDGVLRSARNGRGGDGGASEERLFLSPLLGLKGGHLSLEESSLGGALTLVLDFLLLDALRRPEKTKGMAWVSQRARCDFLGRRSDWKEVQTHSVDLDLVGSLLGSLARL